MSSSSILSTSGCRELRPSTSRLLARLSGSSRHINTRLGWAGSSGMLGLLGNTAGGIERDTRGVQAQNLRLAQQILF